jgi:hypothetical protein
LDLQRGVSHFAHATFHTINPEGKKKGFLPFFSTRCFNTLYFLPFFSYRMKKTEEKHGRNRGVETEG